MMNLSQYQTLIDKIGYQNLDEAGQETYAIVKEGSGDFTDPDLWQEMLVDDDIREAYELHTQALQNMLKDEIKPEMKVEKTKPSRKPKTPVSTVVKPKKVVKAKKVKQDKVKAKATRKTKAKPAKRTNKLRPKKEPVTFPVTVKRLSKELQLIKRFAAMDGKQKSLKTLQSFNRALEMALDMNPHRKETLQGMHKRLSGLLQTADEHGATDVRVKLEVGYKDELKALVKGTTPRLRVEYLDGLNGPAEDALFQNINSIDEHTKDTFTLKGALGKFLGDLEKYKLAMSIEGDQGAGKTQFAFQLADGFADLGYNVGIFQLEIGANSNIMRRNRDKYLKPANRPKVMIAGEAPQGIETIREYATRFGVIIIDSWTKLDVDSEEFDKLRNDFPDTIWVVLFQRTTTNKIRGGTKPLYDAGINIEVVKADETFVNNYAVATKNRYGQTGLRFNIAKQKITE